MFKRFFIGLLILTALGSEGIANFPGNIYNFYLNHGSELGSTVEKEVSFDELQATQKNVAVFYSGAYGNGFILSLESIQKLKCKDLACNDNFGIQQCYANIFTHSVFESFVSSHQKDILQKSDNSPPKA